MSDMSIPTRAERAQEWRETIEAAEEGYLSRLEGRDSVPPRILATISAKLRSRGESKYGLEEVQSNESLWSWCLGTELQADTSVVHVPLTSSNPAARAAMLLTAGEAIKEAVYSAFQTRTDRLEQAMPKAKGTVSGCKEYAGRYERDWQEMAEKWAFTHAGTMHVAPNGPQSKKQSKVESRPVKLVPTSTSQSLEYLGFDGKEADSGVSLIRHMVQEHPKHLWRTDTDVNKEDPSKSTPSHMIESARQTDFESLVDKIETRLFPSGRAIVNKEEPENWWTDDEKASFRHPYPWTSSETFAAEELLDTLRSMRELEKDSTQHRKWINKDMYRYQGALNKTDEIYEKDILRVLESLLPESEGGE